MAMFVKWGLKCCIRPIFLEGIFKDFLRLTLNIVQTEDLDLDLMNVMWQQDMNEHYFM